MVLVCLLVFVRCKKEGKLYSVQSNVKLDLEYETENKKAVNSSTQSINRYSSNLRNLTGVDFSFNEDLAQFNVTLKDQTKSQFLKIKNIDAGFISPLLPYKFVNSSPFDIANIILAEYSRNGISIPIQDKNESYATVEYSKNLFNNLGEYIFENGKYEPNPGVLPKRINFVNNCLRPGLFEIGASDAVGEMYHSWVDLDRELYNKIVSNQTGIDPQKIPADFDNPAHFDKVKLELEKLRINQQKIGTYSINYNKEKEIGGYSSQDSRRKVQRKFYDVVRNGEVLTPKKQEELSNGDKFSMFSFEEPGIYNPFKRTDLTFSREWTKAEVSRVKPITSYTHQEKYLPSEYIELKLLNATGNKGLIIGNVPLALLSFKNDFVIPSFGVGVLLSSEMIERRLLRKKEGPRPSYAYLISIKEENEYIENNHKIGLEQIYLRPVKKEGAIYLRCTIVSYERITDLIEFEILIPDLENDFLKNDAAYSPPIFETYQDDNTL